MPLSFYSGVGISIARLNDVVNHKMTGEEVQDLPSYLKWPGMKVFITQNSPDNTFVANNYYTLSNDMTQWTKDGLKGHTHLDSEDGGPLIDTLLPNIPTTIEYDKRYAKVAAFYTSTTSSGTVTDDLANTRIILNTGTTNNSVASIYDGGARQLNFAKSSAFESTMRQESSTSFKTKVGINAENVQDTNNPAVPSYGIEGCSSTGSTWLIWSSNGTTRSTLTTASTIAPASPEVYLVQHVPASTITLSINGVALSPKSTHVPATGLASLNNLYKAGIQTTTTASKILNH